MKEIAIAFAFTITLPIILSTMMWFIVKQSLVSYKEYWNNKIEEVDYYESWDEEVPCRHPKYRTETYTDSDGHTHTREVFDGYKHLYDVDDHPERWEGIVDSGDAVDITQGEYDLYKGLWGNSTFIDMNRHYHSKDGDKYFSSWNNQIMSIFPYTSIHTYKNKVRASHSIFNYSDKKVNKEIEELFKHPINKNSFEVFFNYGVNVTTVAENDYLRKVNALLGRAKEIHCMVFLMDSEKYDQSVTNDFRYVWNGPNKNELDIFIGVNKDKDVVWCDIMSWCDDTTIHAKIRQAIFDLKKYNGMKIVDIVKDMVPQYWSRKHFRDFKYLSIDMPMWVSIICILASIAWNIGCAFMLPPILEDFREKRRPNYYRC